MSGKNAFLNLFKCLTALSQSLQVGEHCSNGTIASGPDLERTAYYDFASLLLLLDCLNGAMAVRSFKLINALYVLSPHSQINRFSSFTG